MSYEELKIIQEDTDLRIIGTNYWLASNDNSRNLYTVDIDGSLSRSASSHARGYRPVVELKAKILTTGEGQNEFGQKAWELVKMK